MSLNKRPTPGNLIVRVVNQSNGLFHIDKATPLTRGEVESASPIGDEWKKALVPGAVVYFTGGVQHDELGVEYKIIPQGKVVMYEDPGG